MQNCCPLLFLLYINDIENCSEIISFVMYADDTNAFYSDKMPQIFNACYAKRINEVTKWLNASKLSTIPNKAAKNIACSQTASRSPTGLQSAVIRH